MAFFNDLNQFENNIAVKTLDRNFTYQELLNLSDDLFKNINQRTLVFCLTSNTIESLVGYVSFLRNDIVPVMIDSSLDKSMLSRLINLYEPSYIWLPSVSIESLDCKSVYNFESYLLLKTDYSVGKALNDNLALLLTTSGSTGSPKLVRQSYENLISNTNSIIEYLGISELDRPITTLPMNYTYGLSIINSHLQKGATILLTDKTIMQKEFWTFYNENKPTTFGGVPFTYQMLDKLRFFRKEHKSLRYLTQAGGKLPYDLTKKIVEQCKENNIEFIVMYGQTEATARMSYLPSQYALTKCGSMGIAIPGGTFSLIDEKGDLIENSDVVGELVYKGNNVTLGYAENKEDLSLGDERFGVLVTGDMAKRDSDNFYYIVGRKKRFVKIFGSRVNLDETERILFAKGFNCACAGVDDKMMVYTENQGKEKEILKELATLLHLNGSAFSVKYIEEIPKNESGKILYKQLENL